MFADDTNLLYKDRSLKALFDTMNEELKKVADWFQANKLSLNVKKTNYMLFHPRAKSDDLPLVLPQLSISNTPISKVSNTKFLGVIIDENLSWSNHINTAENKISKNIGILCKGKTFMDSKCLRQLYFSFIHSYINYSNIVWGNSGRINANYGNFECLSNKSLSKFIFYV